MQIIPPKLLITFWEIVKPLFTDEVERTECITIVENDRILQEDNQVDEIFNDFFSNAVNMITLKIMPNISILKIINAP